MICSRYTKLYITIEKWINQYFDQKIMGLYKFDKICFIYQKNKKKIKINLTYLGYIHAV